MNQDEINIESLKILQADVKRLEENRVYHKQRLDELQRDCNNVYTELNKKIGEFGAIARGLLRERNVIVGGLKTSAQWIVIFLALYGIFAAFCQVTCKADETQPNWKAGSYQLLDVDKVSFEYAKIRNQRDGYYLVDDDNFDYRMAFLMDFKVLEVLYWKNDVHMMAADSHVRAVGWQYEGGVHVFKNADLFWFHHSQHVLEREPPVGLSNPLENRYGFRINFINK